MKKMKWTAVLLLVMIALTATSFADNRRGPGGNDPGGMNGGPSAGQESRMPGENGFGGNDLQNNGRNQMPGNMPMNRNNNQNQMPQNGSNGQNQMPGNVPQNGGNGQNQMPATCP